MAQPSHRFPRTRRLLTADEFRRVFAATSARSSDRYLTLLARPNGRAVARLGFAISRKAVRRAVDRNRLKRLVREDFRRRQDIVGMDIIVMARNGVAQADSVTVQQSLNRHWACLLRRCAAPSSPSSESTGSC